MDHPTLRKGDSGPDVIYLQTLLCDVGETLKADGKFGEKTEKAVKDFQILAGLPADGIVGSKTWDALEKATAHEPDVDDPEAPEQPETVTISRADWETICRIVHKYESVG
jgi:peptidoglycan hydrolase-like protein with peptidoglycan-binding domain